MEEHPTWPQEMAEYYRKKGVWRGETFNDMLRERAMMFAEKIAVKCGTQSISYRQLDTKAKKLASGFHTEGLQKGDRVIVQLPNSIDFFIVIFALFRIGAWPIFALPSHRRSELVYLCQHAEAKAYITANGQNGFDYPNLAKEVQAQASSLQHIWVAGIVEAFPSLDEMEKNAENQNWPDIQASDIAFLQLSGGSTGLPKMIPRTHDDYLYSIRKSNDICKLREYSVYLASLPIAHNYPLSSPGVLGTMYAGGRVVLAQGSSPDEAFTLIEQEQVTIAALVPPLALVWLEAAPARNDDLASLEILQVGGAKFSAEAARRVRPVLGCQLQQVFGMAEGLVNYTRLDDPEETIVHTQGRPMSPYDEVRVVDEDGTIMKRGEVGELQTRGPYTIRGYYRASEHNHRTFTDDGFYCTGDIVRLAKDGSIIVEGRAKDQINRGGEKIAAEEIENHLLAHPAVHDAAVIAIPDEFLGERSCAVIVPKKGALANTREIKSFLQARSMASYKIPDRFEYKESFPQTGVGKTNKQALRAQLANQYT
ncbi:(2,3-dihydroxybenzoyl)adenylate synthase [Salicibibacter cibi]|uniref:(2,3-dihydroxybenzoyl)adenylate synthase n=1 Tax=Salicibibacter cibi TaxID=2743001 RepID=A0A7T7CGT2_9BACI|nr:(2,3-dihydroxybenzoyl)adenylate synthase [Salicibibacter cibi]QQK81512.1 (2,3-dihydroxybenzoyl)adenylate synthase [Salicibibacter cibi]